MAAWFALVIALFMGSSSALLWWRTRRSRTYIAVPGRIVERSLAGAFIGDELTVYVDPRNPADVVIDRRGTGVAILAGSLGVVLLLIAYVAFNL